MAGWHLRPDGVAFVQALYEPRDHPDLRGGHSASRRDQLGHGIARATSVRRADHVQCGASTVRGCGALNFLATGKVSDGDTAHDRQQPHDLTGLYERALRGPWK